jgi:hypothetical protein
LLQGLVHLAKIILENKKANKQINRCNWELKILDLVDFDAQNSSAL